MTMEILTLYAGQGNFAVVRHGAQAIAVDTRRPAELSDDMASKVDRFLRRRELVGIVLTGFDDDHADPDGLDWLLEAYAAAWVMYPKYYKETENARLVFNVIRKHERRRENTPNPLERVSVRLDRLDSRYLDELSDEFELGALFPARRGHGQLEQLQHRPEDRRSRSRRLRIPRDRRYGKPALGQDRGLVRRCLGGGCHGGAAPWVQERGAPGHGPGGLARYGADQRWLRQPVRTPGREGGGALLARRRTRVPDQCPDGRFVAHKARGQ